MVKTINQRLVANGLKLLKSDAMVKDLQRMTAPMGERVQALDWSATPLGPRDAWATSLTTALDITLNSRQPMFIAWGTDLTFIDNDAYAQILGNKHPAALGLPFQQVWREIWDDIKPLIDRALEGEATWSENLPLTMDRKGYRRTPGGHSRIPPFETTRRRSPECSAPASKRPSRLWPKDARWRRGNASLK